jgi:hypothetical protein
MQVRFSRLSLLGLGAAVLTSAQVALAQSSDNALPAAVTGVLLFCLIIVGLAFYVYMSLAFKPSPLRRTPKTPGWPGFRLPI